MKQYIANGIVFFSLLFLCMYLLENKNKISIKKDSTNVGIKKTFGHSSYCDGKCNEREIMRIKRTHSAADDVKDYAGFVRTLRGENLDPYKKFSDDIFIDAAFGD